MLRAADALAGRRAKCPGCGGVVRVPAPAAARESATAAAGSSAHAAPAFAAPPTPPPPPPPPPAPRAPVMAGEPETYGGYDTNDDDGDDKSDSGEIPLADPPPPTRTAARAPVMYVPPPRPDAGKAAGLGMSSVGTDRPPRSMSATLPDDVGVRRHLYWVLLIVLVPLAWSTLHKSPAELESISDRLERTVQAHPEVAKKLESLSDNADKADVLGILPDHRLDGALLPDDTWMHWVFAALSGVAFLAAILLLFPRGHAKLHSLALIGVFTGTAGIILLLAFQWLAFHMPLFRGRGIITLILDLIWLIGQSYRMALGDHGFILSFLGFTAGVGFCEEAIKALPIIVKARGSGFETWRSAMLWGLISGVGFGVSEGITYSTDYYNGISAADAYVVRFVSCVGLHAIWAAAVGIMVFRRQDFFRGEMHVLEWLGRTLQVVIVPMVLHGLYDTLLKQDHEAWALAIALISFGWLAFQIEKARRDFDAEPAQVSPALA
jgi:RsiW-degrading membrane proteinase PrsW (M82 family)